jgi:hypothetical protein
MPDSPSKKFMTAEEFFESAEPTDVLELAVEELREEHKDEVIDKDQARLNETWTVLAHQVVGQESF